MYTIKKEDCGFYFGNTIKINTYIIQNLYNYKRLPTYIG